MHLPQSCSALRRAVHVLWLVPLGAVWWFLAPEPAEGESDLLRDFHRYITEGVEPGISARNNLETMAACEMMVRSITRGLTCRREEL